MENLFVLNRTIEGRLLISVFEGKKLILEKKIDFLYFDNIDDINRLFSIIKTDWKINLKFKSGSSFYKEKVFIIENEKFFFSLIKKTKSK